MLKGEFWDRSRQCISKIPKLSNMSDVTYSDQCPTGGGGGALKDIMECTENWVIVLCVKNTF